MHSPESKYKELTPRVRKNFKEILRKFLRGNTRTGGFMVKVKTPSQEPRLLPLALNQKSSCSPLASDESSAKRKVLESHKLTPVPHYDETAFTRREKHSIQLSDISYIERVMLEKQALQLTDSKIHGTDHFDKNKTQKRPPSTEKIGLRSFKSSRYESLAKLSSQKKRPSFNCRGSQMQNGQ